MFRVLNMIYDTLGTPQACVDTLAEYREFNDPVSQFMSEIMGQLQWDLVSFTFLYDLYKSYKNVNDRDGLNRCRYLQERLLICCQNMQIGNVIMFVNKEGLVKKDGQS
ncbi:hypothetical protein CYK73_12665 [Clostridium perfringens]|nr:hypothetical protein CYK73_12665 [Clostridium perfringens]